MFILIFFSKFSCQFEDTKLIAGNYQPVNTYMSIFFPFRSIMFWFCIEYNFTTDIYAEEKIAPSPLLSFSTMGCFLSALCEQCMSDLKVKGHSSVLCFISQNKVHIKSSLNFKTWLDLQYHNHHPAALSHHIQTQTASKIGKAPFIPMFKTELFSNHFNLLQLRHGETAQCNSIPLGSFCECYYLLHKLFMHTL